MAPKLRPASRAHPTQGTSRKCASGPELDRALGVRHPRKHRPDAARRQSIRELIGKRGIRCRDIASIPRSISRVRRPLETHEGTQTRQLASPAQYLAERFRFPCKADIAAFRPSARALAPVTDRYVGSADRFKPGVRHRPRRNSRARKRRFPCNATRGDSVGRARTRSLWKRMVDDRAPRFLETFVPRQEKADHALHNGDPGPRTELWSREDPITLLGAFGLAASGWKEVSEAFRWVASQFTKAENFRLEVIAAGVSGDLAYTVGYEHSMVSRGDGPLRPHRLRVTHVYRREDGEWKVVHRHGDALETERVPSVVEQS